MHYRITDPAFERARCSRNASNLGAHTPEHPTNDLRCELQNLRVLVVDDDPLSAKLITALLADEGCRVRVAPSAEDALAMLHAFTPSVVVLDLVLPKMSGLLFARVLKHHPKTCDAVFIAVTAFGGGTTEIMASEAGFAACVRKPIDTGSFAWIVASHLPRSET